ncbi:MAG: hypothetical protein FJW37_12020 [Acidobacteria bacterium]|nr:hypothetical protein [Acidobacteriota bacterium]
MPSYTNISGVGGAGDQAVKYVHHTWVVTDGLSIVKGRHNFKTGMEYRWVAVYTTQNSSSGVFDFNRVQTAFPSSQGRATTGNPFASFLLGQVDRGELYIGDQPLRFRVPYFATYFQDDFRVRSNLTINMGLRWDTWWPMSERDGKYSIMDPSVPNPAAGGRPGGLIFAGSGPNRTGSSRLTRGVSNNNFGPRLGLAWTVRPRLVVRTGYGISFFPTTALGAGGNRNSSRGFDGLITRINQNQGLTATFNWDNGFPTDFVPPPFVNAGFNVGSTINMWNDNAHEPSYRQDWSFGIQRDLGADWLVDVAYVGAKGTRLPTGVFNPNQVDPKYLSLGDLLLRPIGDPSVVAAGFRPPYQGFKGTLAQSLRPFPQYAYVGTVGVNGFDQSAPVGNSTYHSAQVKLEKRFSKGLFLLSSYTWSKNLTDSSSQWGGFFSTSARDHYNRSIDKALSLVDITHRWTNGFTYELPIGPGKAVAANVPKALAQVIGGWQFNGILIYQSGLPLAARVANTLPLFNDRNAPDVVGGVPQSLPRANFDPARDRLLNSAAFRVPAPFKYGNAPATLNVRELPLLNEDFGFSKRFSVTERASIEFRFEMFNMFNRTRFAGVDQTRGTGELLTDVFSFGRVIRQANPPRQTQFHLRVTF